MSRDYWSDFLAAKTEPDSRWSYELNDYDRPCVMAPEDDCSTVLQCAECPLTTRRA